MNISPLSCGWRVRAFFLAAAFLLSVALPVHSQDTPGTERVTIDFEGMRIVFPKGEEDVVEQLKPALRKYREERQKVAAGEARELAESLSGAQMKEMFRKPVAWFMARDSVGPEYDAQWVSMAETMHVLADAAQIWSGDLSELQLWRQEELAPFQTRPDGTDNAEGMRYRFPQISFGQNGARFSLHPPYLVALVGRDLLLRLGEKTQPLRLDVPLFYKAGESPEEIAKYTRTFLEGLSPFLHQEQTKSGFGLVATLPQWVWENLFLAEIEAHVVEYHTAQETALAEGIARILLFAQILKQNGEQKTLQDISRIFPFGLRGWDTSDPEAILRTLEKLDPLAKADRANVTERIFSRNLIALALLDIGQKGTGGLPILQKFKEAGVAIPAGGFTLETFSAAVDTAYGEKELLPRTVAARKATTLEQLRQSVVQQKEKLAKDHEKPAEQPPEAAAPVPNRESAKFGAITITYPGEFKAAVAIVGPEYAKLLAEVRTAVEEFSRKAPPTTGNPQEVEADQAALRAYGIEPDANVIRKFVALTDLMRDGTQITRWFCSGDRLQIWIKEDMMSFLQGGGKIPQFSLSPDGEGVTWALPFNVAGQIEIGPDAPPVDPAKARAEMLKVVDAIPRPEYPIIFKRSSLPKNMQDAAAVAAAIRAGDAKIFDALREVPKTPELGAKIAAAFGQSFNAEQAWFLVAHETTEWAIINTAVRSADRRWFCDGMANWVAMQDVDRRFGAGKGAEAFAKSYNAAELRKDAAKVDLLTWPTEEEIKDGSRPNVENVPAYYYFATLVMQKACEGRGADFIHQWLDEIRKTPISRANAGTILAAYQKLTGKDLRSIMSEVVKAG